MTNITIKLLTTTLVAFMITTAVHPYHLLMYSQMPQITLLMAVTEVLEAMVASVALQFH